MKPSQPAPTPSLMPILVGVSVTYGLLGFLLGAAILAKMAVLSETLPSIIGEIFTSPTLLFDLFHYTFFSVAVYILLGMIWHYIWRPIDRRHFATLSLPIRASIAFTGFFPVLMWITFLNGIRHPQSPFAPSVEDSTTLESFFVAATLCISITILWAATLSVTALPKRLRNRPHRFLFPTRAFVGFGLLLIGGTLITGLWTDRGNASAERNRPDVILIGFDSLRVDHVGFFKETPETLTPTIDAFLAQSAVFENAWTPLGRTFPAWLSILTGKYPKNHRAAFNLVNRNTIDDNHSMPRWLGELGYYRLYAIDDTQFSNIDRSYGFDEVVTPLIGAASFFITSAGVTPLVNLIANTAAGTYLFPSVHANRAVVSSYRPETFDRTLERSIERVHSNQPLFLTVHFELPHWPYTWANNNHYEVSVPQHLAGMTNEPYIQSVARVDEQLNSLIQTLKRTGRLENAIVVMLTDHGEAFSPSEPNWQPQLQSEIKIPNHAGHGTNVFSTAQKRVILGFRGYGRQSQLTKPYRNSRITVSLADIAPTIADWLDIPEELRAKEDGQSLLASITEIANTIHQPRAIPLETGFTPNSIKLGAPDHAEIFNQSALYYEVTESGRLAMREQWIAELKRDKQRAVVAGDWILAALPSEKSEQDWDLILGNHRDRLYWEVRKSNPPTDAPFELLLRELCDYFGGEPAFDLSECPVRSQKS